MQEYVGLYARNTNSESSKLESQIVSWTTPLF